MPLQRPLWASTGVKDPSYSPTLYVDGLVTEGSVNTMPEATLNAVAEASPISEETVISQHDAAAGHFAQLAEIGIDMDAIYRQLEDEGVAKFVASWQELLASVDAGLRNA